MNKAEIIEQVKKMLFGSEMKFAEAKLADGTIVYTDGQFEVGSEVYTLDEQGNKVPVFDAEHVLEDGSVVATVGGKITEIKPAENLEDVAEAVEDVEDAEDVVDEDMIEKQKMSEEEILSKLLNLESRIAELESEKEEMKKKMDEEGMNLSKVQEATVYLAEQFSKTPAGEKLEVKSSGYIDQFKNSTPREDRMKNLMKTISSK